MIIETMLQVEMLKIKTLMDNYYTGNKINIIYARWLYH